MAGHRCPVHLLFGIQVILHPFGRAERFIIRVLLIARFQHRYMPGLTISFEELEEYRDIQAIINLTGFTSDELLQKQ